MNARQNAIMAVIENRYGRANAISSNLIGTALGIDDGNGNPVVRGDILVIMRETGLPIGSCSDGYFVIVTPRELTDYVGHLEDRIAGIEDRIDLVQRCYEAYTPGEGYPFAAQTTVDEFDADADADVDAVAAAGEIDDTDVGVDAVVAVGAGAGAGVATVDPVDGDPDPDTDIGDVDDRSGGET